MLRSLVGSEMCIRDRSVCVAPIINTSYQKLPFGSGHYPYKLLFQQALKSCLNFLYTSWNAWNGTIFYESSFMVSLFVWIVSAMTVTKVVEGCVYIRRRYYGTLPRVGGEFEHSALSPISLSALSLRSLSLALSSNATAFNHLIRLRGSQGIQIWKQRTTRRLPLLLSRIPP